MTSASSTVWPSGKYESIVRHICSSGPSTRSVRGWPWSPRETILNSMSGESKVLPREFAYFLKIKSRTSSTKSSSLIFTSVGEDPGLRTHTLRDSMLDMLGKPGVKKADIELGKAALSSVSGAERSLLAGASTTVFTILAFALLRIPCRRTSGSSID